MLPPTSIIPLTGTNYAPQTEHRFLRAARHIETVPQQSVPNDESEDNQYSRILAVDQQEDAASVSVPSNPPEPNLAETLEVQKMGIALLAQNNQWPQVLGLCELNLKKHPQDLELLETKGYAHIGLGQYSEALQCSKQLLNIKSDHENAQLLQNTCSTKLKQRAEGLMSEKRWQEACADYDALMGVSPHADILRNLCTCLLNLSQWEIGLRCFKNLMDHFGEQDISVWIQIGFCCLKRREEQAPFLQGEAEFALEACKRLLTVPQYSQDIGVWRLGFLSAMHLHGLRAKESAPS